MQKKIRPFTGKKDRNLFFFVCVVLLCLFDGAARLSDGELFGILYGKSTAVA